jgi:hypothetical protein
MLKTPSSVRAGLPFLPPADNPWLLRFASAGSWLYVRLGNRVRREETHGMERLVEAYRDMQEGRSRLIVAFRHPGVEDGTMVFRLMSGIVNREARRLGARLPRPARGYFLYGRDVPEWSGQFLTWMLPLLGAIPVYPGRHDSRSIAAIRRCVTDMPHPLALAPEGQVTYHNDHVPALEDGTARIGFWCMEDLRKRSRAEDVVIVPVCSSYHYDQRGWRGLLRLLARVEAESGLEPGEPGEARGRSDPRGFDSPSARRRTYDRFRRAERRVLDLAEEFYGRFFGVRFPPAAGDEEGAALQERLRRLCEAAIGVVERFFHAHPGGDMVKRVLALRQVGLSWMHREGIGDVGTMPPLPRALADRVAQEAWLCMRHLETVDVLEYFLADYLRPDSPYDRFVESITDLWDLVNRLKGGNISGRINPFAKTARIIVNPPISLKPLWDGYARNRREAVASLTQRIAESFRAVAERGNQPVPGNGGT